MLCWNKSLHVTKVVFESFFNGNMLHCLLEEKKCLIIAPFFNYVRNYFSLPGILHTPWCEKLWHFYTCCSLFTRTWKKLFLKNSFHMDYKWPDNKLAIESVSIVFKSADMKLIKISHNSHILSWLIQRLLNRWTVH